MTMESAPSAKTIWSLPRVVQSGVDAAATLLPSATPAAAGREADSVDGDPPRISGRAFSGLFKYAKTRGGPEGVRSLIASLPGEHQALFSEAVRHSDWYPYPAYTSLLVALTSWTGQGWTDSLREFGQWTLQRDAGTVLKILSVFSSVEGLVHRGFGSWGGYLWRRHCNAGEVFLADSGNRTATMGLRGFPGIAAAHCQLIRSYLQAMGRATGAKAIRMTKTRCVHRGDPHCEYRGEW